MNQKILSEPFFRKIPLSVAELFEAVENMPDNITLPDEICLPPDENGLTDEEFGDEDDCDPNRFSRNQLQAGVEVCFDNDDVD